MLLCNRFGEDSVEVADSSFVVALSYIDDDDRQDKAKKYLEDAISLYMKHRGPYHNSTIKVQVKCKSDNISNTCVLYPPLAIH